VTGDVTGQQHAVLPSNHNLAIGQDPGFEGRPSRCPLTPYWASDALVGRDLMTDAFHGLIPAPGPSDVGSELG
jgi:hypothetical protein